MTNEELERLEGLAASATPGPWHVWDGPAYVGGGEDLCIGAGPKWLANMDHRYCASIREATFEVTPCDPDTMTCDICTIDAAKITSEERANAAFIAAARDAVPALVKSERAKDAEIARLRALVEAAYEEGCGDGWGLTTWGGSVADAWNNSDACKALNADKIPQDGAP